MQDFVHGAIRNPMGNSQIHSGRTVVGLHIICDCGDKCPRSSLFILRSGATYYWTYLFDDINCCLCQGSVL